MTQSHYDGRDLEAMSFATNYHAWILSCCRAYLGPKVVEVGAGTGSFSELLLKEPINELIAVEPSQNLYPFLEARAADDARMKTHNTVFEEVAGAYPSTFDTAVYVNVLEHIEDDAKELTHVYESLREGGHVVIFVPALNFLYSEHDRAIGHFRRYTKRPLENLVRSAGFELVSSRYFDSAGILPWYVMMTLCKGSPKRGSVALYDRVVVPIMRLIESVFPIPLGKNLLVVARKPLRYT